MVREIKFRAWDTVHKQMIENFCYLNDGRFFGYDDTNNYIGVGSEHIMQYTGLKDCKGVDVYEGDVVTCTTKNDFEFPNQGVVEYLPTSFAIYCGRDITKDDEPKLYTWFQYNKDFEVIGNIYQTPELLTTLTTKKDV